MIDDDKLRITVDLTHWLADVPARLGRIEATVEQQGLRMKNLDDAVTLLRSEARTDFRLLFGALIAVALGLAGMMAHGFRWI